MSFPRKRRSKWLLVSIGMLALAAACGDTTPVFSGFGGGFGSGGTAGTGTSGTGGSGTGGSGGSGGIAGTGGSGGSGGSGAIGGSGGFGGFGGTAECQRSFLCQQCPSGSTCTSDSECLPGIANVCVDTGCKTLDGEFIGQCALLDGAGDCDVDQKDCGPGYECVSVGFGKYRCIKTPPGCIVTGDCPRGFYCENSECVDRRVPCLVSADCPKSHFCNVAAAAKFCERAYRSCDEDGDCPRQCADIDDDGMPECAPTLDTSDPPSSCLNSDCGGSDPVCELGDTAVQASCGKYGLCADEGDCPTNFDCVALWPDGPDGRSECVPSGGSCTNVSQCSERQVCASPRGGGPPSCQAGLAGPSP